MKAHEAVAARSLSQSGDSLLARIVQDYLAAVDAGQAPSRHALLARYPDVAGALGLALDGLDALHAAVRSSSSGAPSPALGEMPAGPQPVGDFRILREIGRGGMGVVYEAEQLSLARRVALKVLPFAAALDPRHLRRFQTEAQAAAGLHHPHIVPVHAVGTDRGIHYYAMQLIEGQSLARVLTELRGESPSLSGERRGLSPPCDVNEEKPHGGDKPRRSPDEDSPTSVAAALSTELSGDRAGYYRSVARLARQAAEALAYAHDLDVIHRDVKPANLLLNAHGHLWLTDFGLARLGSATGLTHTGEMLGTPRYMSPEQAAGQSEQTTRRTDIYSLGATLYELLTRVPAFPQTEREDVLCRIQTEEPPPPRQHDPRIPHDLETIVLKAMAKVPAERYATAQEMADDLQRFLDNHPVLARRPGMIHRMRKWAQRHRTALAILFAGAVLGLVASQTWTWRAYRAEAEGRRQSELNRAETAVKAASRIARTTEKAFRHVKQLGEAEQKDLHQSLTEAVEILDGLHDENPTHPQVRYRLGCAYNNLAEIRDRMVGLKQDAIPLTRRALSIFERLAAEFPHDRGYRFSVFHTLHFLSARLPRFDEEKEQTARRALAVILALHEEDPANFTYREALATQYNQLAHVLIHAEKSASEVEDCCQRAIALIRALLLEDPKPSHRKNLIVGLRNLGALRAREARVAEALQLFQEARQHAELTRQALPADPYYSLLLYHTLREEGQFLHALKDWKEADRALAQALDAVTAHAKDYPIPDHDLDVTRVLVAQAFLYDDMNRTAERDAKQQVAFAKCKELEHKFPWFTDGRLHYLANLLEPPNGKPELEEALRVAKSLNDPLWLGLVHARRKEWGDAITQLEKLPAAYEPKRAWGRMVLALCYWHASDKERARRLYDEVMTQVTERGVKGWEGERYRRELEELMGVGKKG